MKFSYYSQNCYLLPLFLSPKNNSRTDNIISVIKRESPDIIALQEIWEKSAVNKIKRELRDYSFIDCQNSFFNKGGLLTGIRDKKILATSNFFTLPAQASIVEKLGCKGYQTLRLPNNKIFINTHLYAPTNEAAKTFTFEQFKMLSRLFEYESGILAGDLNIEQGDFLRINSVFKYTKTNSFTLSKKNKYANSYLNNTPYDKKIDYCLGTSGVEVTENILSYENSDHFALTGIIVF